MSNESKSAPVPPPQKQYQSAPRDGAAKIADESNADVESALLVMRQLFQEPGVTV